MQKERITLQDSMISSMMKLSEGNPGAINMILQCTKLVPTIDPDHLLGSFGFLLSLDSYGIYGSKIWILYKDVCHEDPEKVILLLRATQLGIFTRQKLQHSIENMNGSTIDFEDLLKKVQEELPRFGKK